MGLFLPQTCNLIPFRTAPSDFARIVKAQTQKNRALGTVVHRALESGNSGWYSRWAHHLPLANSIRCFQSHLQSAAGLIRFFCQLEQYPHQFGVIQRLLAAEEPIVDKTHHRRLGSAKFG